jgi:catechol 2,3-dioxygenase
MTIDPAATIGHVHLKVADLDRAIGFYRDLLGFTLNGRIAGSNAFLAAGDYHHHIGLTQAPPGLLHTAIRYPTRAALIAAVRALQASGHPLSHGSDHGGSEAVYVADPDGNGLELYWDRPVAEWPRTPDGRLALVNFPLDLEALTAG